MMFSIIAKITKLALKEENYKKLFVKIEGINELLNELEIDSNVGQKTVAENFTSSLNLLLEAS